jgi:RNA polymerase sigma factor (sigma-70 family)
VDRVSSPAIQECIMAQTTAIRRAPSAGTAAPVADATPQLSRSHCADAWGGLVDRHSRMLWAIAAQHRLSAADSADVFQTTWLRLVEHMDAIKDPAAVGGWLRTTARHECLRVLRQAQRHVPVGDELPEQDDEPWEPAERLVRAERDAALRAAVGRLRASDQALLETLTADPAPSYQEISIALGLPIGSIGPTRARCLQRLRRELERGGALNDAHVCA